MFVQPIGDSVVLTKLAFDIYRHGYQVAKHAPEEFRRLLDELRFSRDMFYWMQQNVKGEDNAFVQEALTRCMIVLEEEFKPLVKKFEALGSTDRTIFFKRVQFAVDKRRIQNCRQALLDAKDHLHLVLTAHSLRPQSPKLAQPRLQGNRIRGKPIQAIEVEDISDAESFVTAASDDEGTEDELEEGTDGSVTLGGLPGSFEPPSFPNFNSSQSASSVTTGPPARIPTSDSPSPSKPWRGIVVQNNDQFVEGHSLNQTTTYGSSGLKESRAPSIADSGYATLWREPSVSSELSEARLHSHKSFVLRKRHLTSALMQRALYGPAELEELFDEEAKVPETDMNLESWLLCAVWWYLKSRTIWNILAADVSEKPIGRSASDWPITVSIFQTHIDLMKSDFILRRMVLARLVIGDSVAESQWKTIQELSSGIREEQRRRELNAKNLGNDELNEHDFGFAESFAQPVEEPNILSEGMKVPQAIDSLDPPDKWLSIQQDHAGYHRKEVIFRSFVNAEIGDQDIGRRSPSAPYLLVLSSPQGSSDLTVSLINQRGTVSLSRSMISEDIKKFERDTKAQTIFHFEFPSQDAIIQFLSREDIDNFLERPRKFFAATKDRDPKEGEFLVFRDTLQAFDDLKPDQHQPHIEPLEKESHQDPNGSIPARKSRLFCELSLYEQFNEVCWKTTRRLVICSTPDEPEPWCVSFWLPLGDAYVEIAEYDIRLLWPDFKFHETKSSGDWGTIHSFTYQYKQPNRELWLTFQSSNVAQAFANCILNPFHTPFEMQEHVNKLAEFESPAGGRESILYQMRNLNAGNEGYHAIVTIDKTVHSKYHSQVFFVFRDLDFKLETEAVFSVGITNLIVPHYISTMVNLNEYPRDDGPKLKAIQHVARGNTFEFGQFEELEAFTQKLTGWHLKLHCRARSMNIHHKLTNSKTLKDMAISLWEKPSSNPQFSDRMSLRMTARAVQGNEAWWTTTNLDRSSGIDRHHGRDVVIGKIDVKFGTKVDTFEMEAVKPSKSQQSATPKGKVSIAFEEEAFARHFVGYTSRPFEDWIPEVPSRANTNASVGSANWPPLQSSMTQLSIQSPEPAYPRRRATQDSFSQSAGSEWPPGRRATQGNFADSQASLPAKYQSQDFAYTQAKNESFDHSSIRKQSSRRETEQIDPLEFSSLSRSRTQDSFDAREWPPKRRTTQESMASSIASSEWPPKRRGTQEPVGSPQWVRQQPQHQSFDSSPKFPLVKRSTARSFDKEPLPPMHEER